MEFHSHRSRGPLAQTNCLSKEAGWLELDFAQGTPGFQIFGIPGCLSNLRSFGSQKPEASGPYRATPATRSYPGHEAEMLRLQLPECAV